MTRFRRPAWIAVEVFVVAAVFAASCGVFFGAKAKIDSDEGNWIGTTVYFERFFVARDFSEDAWRDSFWTRTQPMVFRYIIGSWLWWRGHDLAAQTPDYDHNKSAQANRRLGLAPSDDVLDDAREPARLMAALATTVLYLVVRVLAGPVGGMVGGLSGAALMAGSPYLQEHLIRAKAESSLMFFLLAALLVAILGISRAGGGWPGVRWGLACGVLLGLAFGVKLTTVLPLVAVALWGAAATLDERTGALRGGVVGALAGRWRGARAAPEIPSPRRAGGRPAWVWPLVVGVTALAVFIGSNPFLWPDPVGRTWLLFDNRRYEMAQQQELVPSRAVHGIDRRFALVWERSVWNDAFGPSRLNQPVEAVLAVVGAAWLGIRAATERRPGTYLLLFLWLGCLWLGVSVGVGFLLPHYFVPTAVTAILLAGSAVGWAVEAGWGALRRTIGAGPKRQRRPTVLVAGSMDVGPLGQR